MLFIFLNNGYCFEMFIWPKWITMSGLTFYAIENVSDPSDWSDEVSVTDLDPRDYHMC